MNRCVLILAGTLIISAVPASAQDPLPSFPAGPGSRIRVHSDAGGRGLRGVVLGVDGDHLTLALDEGASVRLPLGSIRRLEASAGKQSNSGRGSLIGAVAGGLVGAFDSVDPDDCGYDSAKWCSRGEAIGYSALGGAFLGHLIGGLILRTEQWVPLEIGIRPTAGGGAAGAMEAGVTVPF